MAKQPDKEAQMLNEAIEAKFREMQQAVKAPADNLPAPAERGRIRKSVGWKQSDVAELLGVHRLTVSAWERGEYDPKAETRRKYIQLLENLKERAEAKE
ncbi:helix-turn-helix domain-containing protein [Streptomyces sp. NPDC048389]|uniref:helix-turn-helix domain-containing protein n=1 Tax=Streptomyces sp. NPDC048389 TaxID=3154622 RepID=UPI0034520C87